MPSSLALVAVAAAALIIFFPLAAQAGEAQILIDVAGDESSEPAASVSTEGTPGNVVIVSADIWDESEAEEGEEAGELVQREEPNNKFVWALDCGANAEGCTSGPVVATERQLEIKLPPKFEILKIKVTHPSIRKVSAEIEIRNAESGTERKPGEGIARPRKRKKEGEEKDKKDERGQGRKDEIENGTPGRAQLNRGPGNENGPGKGGPKARRGGPKGPKGPKAKEDDGFKNGSDDFGDGSKVTGDGFGVSGGSKSKGEGKGEGKGGGKSRKSDQQFDDSFFAPSYGGGFGGGFGGGGGKGGGGKTGLRGYNRDQITPVIKCSHETLSGGRLKLRCEDPAQKVLRIAAPSPEAKRQAQLQALKKSREEAAMASAKAVATKKQGDARRRGFSKRPLKRGDDKKSLLVPKKAEPNKAPLPQPQQRVPSNSKQAETAAVKTFAANQKKR